jgi:hypothetical protein
MCILREVIKVVNQLEKFDTFVYPDLLLTVLIQAR